MKHIPAFIDQKLTSFGFNDAQKEQLVKYEALIQQWQKAINLISPSTLNDVWGRHILDSAQLWPIIQGLALETDVIDLGSGGGLPGIVLAIAGVKSMTMVESDMRKCVFLRETSREIGLKNVTVLTERIEKANLPPAPIVTARALASLKQLEEWALPLRQENGAMIFLKGQDWKKELAELQGQYEAEAIPSVTDKDARIVILR